MLEKEKPDLVGIGPRWATEHHAMAMAALHAGAHIYLEKPFTISLAEADDILRLAKEKERRVAVAHVARCAPSVLRLEKALREGLIGDVLEIHTVGKMGARAGGQDMMVLGLHVFDLARLFAGDVEWCHARIRQQGQTGGRRRRKRIADGQGRSRRGRRHLRAVRHDFRRERDLPQPGRPGRKPRVRSAWRSSARVASCGWARSAAPTLSLLADPNRLAMTRTENWVDWTSGVAPAADAEIDGIAGYERPTVASCATGSRRSTKSASLSAPARAR